jgi:oligopeptide/dipeptide ABC transporter ATP-binding protein
VSSLAGGAGEVVLSVRDLRVRFSTRRGPAEVVNGVTYDLHRGETLAIVGESGSGKSVSVLALLRLIPTPPGRIEGSVTFGGRDLVTASDAELRRVRGNDIAMVFQDPMTSLNPVLTVGRQITESLELHHRLGHKAARTRAVELLDLVGIPLARRRLDEYPHQLSGGMRQRVMIAMALSCDPLVLVADEATTALDVTIQAQIVDLVARLQEELGMAVIWITHDLGVVAGIADRVLVMYGGQVVEEAGVDQLYAEPGHPYTRGLLASLPVIGAGPRGRLTAIPGLPPDPVELPAGCAFWPRCALRADGRCQSERPPLREVAPGHRVATWPGEVVAAAEGRRA